MPLKESASRETIAANIRHELRAGKSRTQAVAIALKMARKGRPRTTLEDVLRELEALVRE